MRMKRRYRLTEKEEEFEETAAILEYDQGNTRKEAERLARGIVYGTDCGSNMEDL